MTDVSLAGAFLAGLVSFLSPCVLPLVPGYISMLSGIGMEQLRKGDVPTSGLFSSSLAFVAGFSVVFISFGASASAVGHFLLQNRALLAPIAGALILLFGLHLIGALIKLNLRVGIILGVLLVALGVASLLRHAPLAQSRRPPSQQIHAARHLERLPPRLRVRLRLDALYRPDSRYRSCSRRRQRHHRPRRPASRRLLRWPRHSFFAHGPRHRPVHGFLQEFSKISSRRRGIQRRFAFVCRRPGLRQQTDLALD